MQKLKQIFSGKQKLLLVMVFVLALSLPFVINQVLKEQDLRQGAALGDAVKMSLVPTQGNFGLNQEFNVTLSIDTKGQDISAVQGYLNYDPAKLQLISTTGGQNYTAVNTNTGTNLDKPIIIFNSSAQQSMGESVTLAVFKFKTLQEGTTSVSYGGTTSKPLKIAAAGATGNIPHDPPDPIATYTIDETTAPITGPQDPTATPTDVIPSVTLTPDQICQMDPSNPSCITPIPTMTIVPQPTIDPNETLIKLSFSLPGIGVGAPSLGLNSTPIHPQRNATLSILDSTGKMMNTITGIMNYSDADTTGIYTGYFALGTTFPTGTYSVKLKLDNTLVKQFPTPLQITSGTNNPQNGDTPTLISGDLNGDNSIGIIDWTFMIACIKNEAACTDEIRGKADLNDNGGVDETDVQILQRGFALREGD